MPVLGACLAATMELLAMLQTAPAGTHRQRERAGIVNVLSELGGGSWQGEFYPVQM